MAYVATMNGFISALVNKVILTEVYTKAYNSQLSGFKKESIPMGFKGEFIHVNPVTLTDYSKPTAPAYTDPFKTVNPTVFATYLTVNENKIGEATIFGDLLEDAFTSYEKFDALVQSIINSLYSGNQLWEETTIKAYLTEAVTDATPTINSTTLALPTSMATGQAALLAIMNVSGYMAHPSGTYNTETGAVSFCEPANQRIIMTTDFYNRLNVYNYSGAFHDEFLKLQPQITVIDKIDEDNDSIRCIVMDEACFQFRDRKFEVSSIVNPADLSINYWLRRRSLVGVIPFACAYAFKAA